MARVVRKVLKGTNNLNTLESKRARWVGHKYARAGHRRRRSISVFNLIERCFNSWPQENRGRKKYS